MLRFMIVLLATIGIAWCAPPQATGHKIIESLVYFRPHYIDSYADRASLAQTSTETAGIYDLLNPRSDINKNLEIKVDNADMRVKIKKQVLRGKGPLLLIEDDPTQEQINIVLYAARYCHELESVGYKVYPIQLHVLQEKASNTSLNELVEIASQNCKIIVKKVKIKRRRDGWMLSAKNSSVARNVFVSDRRAKSSNNYVSDEEFRSSPEFIDRKEVVKSEAFKLLQRD